MKNLKILLVIVSLIQFGCGNDFEKKVITADDGKHSLMIIKKNSMYFIYNSLTDSPDSSDYVINRSFIEYFVGLVKWSEGKAYIFQTYGEFDEPKSGSSIVVKIVTTKEFERLKELPEYEYFYY